MILVGSNGEVGLGQQARWYLEDNRQDYHTLRGVYGE